MEWLRILKTQLLAHVCSSTHVPIIQQELTQLLINGNYWHKFAEKINSILSSTLPIKVLSLETSMLMDKVLDFS